MQLVANTLYNMLLLKAKGTHGSTVWLVHTHTLYHNLNSIEYFASGLEKSITRYPYLDFSLCIGDNEFVLPLM
jgi:hypothetical protein